MDVLSITGHRPYGRLALNPGFCSFIVDFAGIIASPACRHFIVCFGLINANLGSNFVLVYSHCGRLFVTSNFIMAKCCISVYVDVIENARSCLSSSSLRTKFFVGWSHHLRGLDSLLRLRGPPGSFPKTIDNVLRGVILWIRNFVLYYIAIPSRDIHCLPVHLDMLDNPVKDVLGLNPILVRSPGSRFQLHPTFRPSRLAQRLC